MKLKEINGTYSVLKFRPETDVPNWALRGGFFSVSRTDEELSIVCQTDLIEGDIKDREDNWKCLKIEGPLDFNLTGILTSVASPLAKAEISIFAVSTYDTDYVMVKKDKIEEAKKALKAANFTVI